MISPGLVQRLAAVRLQNKIMNARTAGHAGILQLKIFLIGLIDMFRHPKYYKELRKRNKSDRVISNAEATAASERAPGQGLKLRHGGLTPEASGAKHQASSVKLSNQPVQASGGKRQAPGSKLQASCRKRQA